MMPRPQPHLCAFFVGMAQQFGLTVRDEAHTRRSTFATQELPHE